MSIVFRHAAWSGWQIHPYHSNCVPHSFWSWWCRWWTSCFCTCGASYEENQQGGKGLIRFPAVTPRTPARGGVVFQQLRDGLRAELPGDFNRRGSFDTRTRFVAGDPGANFGATAPLEYETTSEVGHPHWEVSYGVCVLWLTIVTWEITRWWHSRLKLVGSHKEKTELLLFPNSKTTGLYHVHSTWAGTFILAALVAVFSGLNFVLLDSDCLPVTLFEDPTWLGFRSDPKVQIQHRVSSTWVGQGVLVVTEPHSELNAQQPQCTTDCGFSLFTSLPVWLPIKGWQGAGVENGRRRDERKGRDGPKWPGPARIRGGEGKNGAKRRQRRT